MKGENKDIQDMVQMSLTQSGNAFAPVKPLITISYLDNAQMKKEKSSVR